MKTSQILHNQLYSVTIYIYIYKQQTLSSINNRTYTYTYLYRCKLRTDYVKNDGYPERSGVQQAAPVYYGPFGDFHVINLY